MEDIPKIVSYDIVLQYMMTCLPEIFAILSFVVLVLVYFYAPYWRVRRVPGPPTTPFLGHLPLLQKYGPDVFRTLAKTYGPIYRFHMGRQPLIIIADPDLCRVVGIQKFKAVSNRSLPSPISASPLHQKGLFYTRDSQWSLMRNTILSLYQPSHLSNLIPVFQTYINSASLTITEHEDIDFSNFTLKLATDIIGHAAFGVDFGLSKFIRSSLSSPTDNDNEEEKEVSQFVNQHIHSTASLKMDLSGSFSIKVGLFFPILQRLVGCFLQFIPGTAEWKVRKNTRNLTDRLNAIVQRRSKQENRTSGDFLSLILNESEAGRGRKGRISEEYVNALTYEHLLAGSTTTSFTVTSIVYLVSGHEDVEKRLLEEIDRFPKSGSPPTSEDLDSQFPYLDQVIKESMRFYTVSPLVARETSQEIEVGGYILPKGTWVWLALGVLAKDARNFPNPDEFRPERFDPSCEEEKKRHPYAHIPFGIGPRSCLGKRFALQEIKLTLIHLYQSYIFRHAEDMVKPPALDYGVVLNFKNGIKLKAIKRSF